MPSLLILFICSTFLFWGCGGKKKVVVEEPPPQKVTTASMVPEASEASAQGVDLKTVQELAGRSTVNPEEAVRVSNRMLQQDVAPVLNEQTLNNLEKILLTALPLSSPTTQSVIQRNLGIVYYYNKKYKKARQLLRSANETNPRDGRTHYYLASLFNQQAKIYSAKGEPNKAQQFQKQAQIEIDIARKLEPGNQSYRKGLATAGE
jgi:tetratricopeptide (TPR) repeat protein